MTTYVITVRATIEVEANSEQEALKNLDWGDIDIDKVLSIEAYDEDGEWVEE